jgi:hypothetical protein
MWRRSYLSAASLKVVVGRRRTGGVEKAHESAEPSQDSILPRMPPPQPERVPAIYMASSERWGMICCVVRVLIVWA